MITLHVLAQSRALRIVWLLELIGTPYQIKTYARHPETLLAPDELKAVHPLGKSPVIDDDGFVLNESGAITDYLIQTYGGHFMPERGSQDYWHYQRWLHYAEGSLMPLLLLGLVFRKIENAPMPFFVKPVARKISGNVKKRLYRAASRPAPCLCRKRIKRQRLAGQQPTERRGHHDELPAASRRRPLRIGGLSQHPRLFAAHRKRPRLSNGGTESRRPAATFG